MVKASAKKSKRKDNRQSKNAQKTKSTFLPKGQNITNIDFKVKKVIIRDQVVQHDAEEILNKNHLSFKDLTSRLKHHNDGMKIKTLQGLKELIAKCPIAVLESNITILFDSLSKLITDLSSGVRENVHKLFMMILPKVSYNRITSLFPSFFLHLICGLTHINKNVNDDTLLILDALLKYTPDLCASKASTLLPICLNLISIQKTGGRSLSLHLESKLSSENWRTRVLSRISAILVAYLNSKSGSKKTNFVSKTYKFSKDISKPEKRYLSLLNEPMQLFSFETDDSKEGKKDFDLKEFIEELMPLLFDVFVELVPTETNILNDCISTNISFVAGQILKNISEIIDCLWKLCHKNNLSECDEKWLKEKFGKSFKKYLIDGRYPYTVNRGGDKSEMKMTTSDHSHNLLLAKLLIILTNTMDWDPVLDYLNGCQRNLKKFSHDDSIHIVSCYYQLCCSGTKYATDYIEPLRRFNKSENKILSSHAFEALYKISDNIKLTRLHNHESFQLWYDSVPEKLTKPSISSKELNIIVDLARKNIPQFLTSLGGQIEVIMGNLPKLEVDGGLQEQEHIKVANLLYQVNDWDSEMTEELQKAIQMDYWGPKVTYQIKCILEEKISEDVI